MSVTWCLRVAIVPHLDRSSKSLESRKRIGRPMQCERWPACTDHTFDEGCAAPAATQEEQAVLAAAVAATTSNPDTAPLPVEVSLVLGCQFPLYLCRL